MSEDWQPAHLAARIGALERALAQIAGRQETHEGVCSERYGRLLDGQQGWKADRDAIWRGIEDLRHTLRQAALWLIGLQVAALGYFLVRFGLPGAS